MHSIAKIIKKKKEEMKGEWIQEERGEGRKHQNVLKTINEIRGISSVYISK